MIPKNVLSTIIIAGLIFLFCLSASLVLAHGQTSQAASMNGGPVTRTQVVFFTPSGVSSTSAAEQKGDCWINSLATPRANAWRCMVSNTIYDPCFSNSQTSSYVLCGTNPAEGNTSGIKVVLSQSLPQPAVAPAEITQAWELRLSNGAVCSFETGATFLVNGQRANYSCSDGLFVIGMPTVGPVWFVDVSKNANPPQNTPLAITSVAVTTAWT